jgi:hypothetical protein
MTKSRTRRNKRSPHQSPHTNLSQPAKPLIEHLETVFSEEKPADEKPENTGSWFSKKLYRIYGIIWLYFIIKTFVVDVEAWVFELVGMERFQLFLGLRIFIVPCLIAVTISWKGYKVVFRHLFHFLTVPFYFTVFLFAKWVYNSLFERTSKRENSTFLVFSLEILGRVLSRFNYYLFSLLGLSTLIICTFYPSDRPIQIGAFVMSLSLVGAVMYQSVLKVIQPLKIFGFFKIDDIISYSKKGRSILPKGDASKPKTRAEAVRELLFSHILVIVLQKNVSEVREKKSFLIVAFADFFVLILTITTFFTFLNYSLFLIMPGSFGGQSNPSFGDFAFYSFYSIPGEGTSIEPVSYMSKIIKVVTTCYGYYLFIFLATILLGVFSEKFTQALESTSEFLQQQSKVSEPKLSSMLGIPIDVLRGLSLTKLVKLIDLVKDEKARNY